MYCNKCKKYVPDGKFCNFCGNSLNNSNISEKLNIDLNDKKNNPDRTKGLRIITTILSILTLLYVTLVLPLSFFPPSDYAQFDAVGGWAYMVNIVVAFLYYVFIGSIMSFAIAGLYFKKYILSTIGYFIYLLLYILSFDIFLSSSFMTLKEINYKLCIIPVIPIIITIILSSICAARFKSQNKE